MNQTKATIKKMEDLCIDVLGDISTCFPKYIAAILADLADSQEFSKEDIAHASANVKSDLASQGFSRQVIDAAEDVTTEVLRRLNGYVYSEPLGKMVKLQNEEE